MQTNKSHVFDTNWHPLHVTTEKIVKAFLKSYLVPKNTELKFYPKLSHFYSEIKISTNFPVSISIKQFATALRKSELLPTPFVTDLRSCKQFLVAAETLGFTRREIETQIQTEKEYLTRTGKYGDSSKSDSGLQGRSRAGSQDIEGGEG